MGILDNIKNKINEIKQNNNEYQDILNNSSTIENLQKIPELQRKEISPTLLTNKNPNINKDIAEIIIDLLPLNEMYLDVIHTNEIKTNKEYFVVPTIKYLWIISKEEYIKFEYNNIKANIIKKNLLTKVLKLSNYILETSNTEEEINTFLNIINNLEYRNSLINETIEKYGDNEIYRTLNNINNGISYDINNNIRFYFNNTYKKYNISELANYELFIDNNVIQERKMSQNQRLTANKNSCYEIKIRITPKDNNIFEIPILERDTMSTMYQSTSDTYINNMKYAKKIMEILDNLKEK